MSKVFSLSTRKYDIPIDKSQFTKDIQLAAVVVDPRQITAFKKQCGHDILEQARLRSIYDRDGRKLIALRPEIVLDNLSTLSEQTRAFIGEHDIELTRLDIKLDYDYWQADDILDVLLPQLTEDRPAGFSMVGHIAHMNLKEEYLPYKHVIGQVILDKNSAIRTVVNKLDTIDSVYRNFQMEVIAGEHDLIAEQHESGCIFRFDFSKVYWNSRLHTEHDRLVQQFQPGHAVCDVMAGVGPFAIPAAKKGVLVFANDLNPASFEALCDNIKINHTEDLVKPFCMDGRQFIRDSLKNLDQARGIITLKPRKKRQKCTSYTVPDTFQHYVMNLPATAIEFLDAFRGIYAERPGLKLPTIHVHCFTKFEDAEARKDLSMRIEAALGALPEITYHHVRRVAPNKDMYCLSFTLPRSIAEAKE